MLGRKNYTRTEIDHARTAVNRQLAAYKKLARAVAASDDKQAVAALQTFEPLFLANLTLVLDRFFVHRVRLVTGKDGNPLNEVELLSEALLEGNVLRANKVIALVPDESVTKIGFGDPIELTVAQFERLAQAYFAEIESRFA